MKLAGGTKRIAAVAICAVILVAKAAPALTPIPNGVLKWKFPGYSAPALGSDGTIYVGQYPADDEGNPLAGSVRALNPDGTTRWSFKIAGHAFAPAIGSDGTIYAGSVNYSEKDFSQSSGDLYAISSKGSQKWKLALAPVQSTPLVGHDGTIYVSDLALHAVTPGGRKEWSLEGMTDPAIGSDGTIYASSRGGLLCAIDPRGKEKWKFQVRADEMEGVPDAYAPAVGADGTIYASLGDRNLYALNPNGTRKWKFRTGDDIQSSPIVGPDRTIYISSKGLYAIYPNGTRKWLFSSPERIYASPAIGADGVIYIGDNSEEGATLHALNPDGKEMWKFMTGGTARGIGDPVSTPVIGVDGTVYWVGSWNGVLYAIGAPASAAAPTPERRQ